MKTGRRFIILTTLLAVLLLIIFHMPESLDHLKFYLGLVAFIILIMFIVNVWKWRDILKTRGIKEIGML